MASNTRGLPTGPRISVKLLAVAATCLLPVLILAYLSLTALTQQILLTRGEQAGVDYGRAVAEVVRAGVDYRRLAGDFLFGRAARSDLEREQGRIDDQLRALGEQEDRLAEVTEAAPADALTKVKARWAAVKTTAAAARPDPRPEIQLLKESTEFLAALRELHAAAGDTSHLLHDPDRAARHATAGLVALLDDADYLGQMQLAAATAAQRKTLRADEVATLHRLVGRVGAAGDGYDAAWAAVARARPDVQSHLAAANDGRGVDRSAFVTAVTDRVLTPTNIETTPDALRDAGQKAVARDFEIYVKLAPVLTADLQARVEARQRQIYAVLLCVAAGLALTLFAAYLVARGLRRQAGAVSAALARVADGDHDARAAVTSGDELGQVAAAVNATLDKVVAGGESAKIQAAIVKLLDDVSGVGRGDLTRDAEVTGDVTGALAAAFNALISHLREVVGDMQIAAERTEAAAAALRAAPAGGATAAARRVKHLAESSQEIGQTVAMLDDLADRTSVLALNASLQAAAAGDAGQGFDAVAAEVERLAERSAATIRTLDGLVKSLQSDATEAAAALAPGEPDGDEEATAPAVEQLLALAHDLRASAAAFHLPADGVNRLHVLQGS